MRVNLYLKFNSSTFHQPPSGGLFIFKLLDVIHLKLSLAFFHVYGIIALFQENGKDINAMYKTIWMVTDESDDGVFKTELTIYHFGESPKFPSWYMKENHSYTIEMIWNFHLIVRPSIFFKCLTHTYIVK